jgi:hypothetical protein
MLVLSPQLLLMLVFSPQLLLRLVCPIHLVPAPITLCLSVLGSVASYWVMKSILAALATPLSRFFVLSSHFFPLEVSRALVLAAPQPEVTAPARICLLLFFYRPHSVRGTM